MFEERLLKYNLFFFYTFKLNTDKNDELLKVVNKTKCFANKNIEIIHQTGLSQMITNRNKF